MTYLGSNEHRYDLDVVRGVGCVESNSALVKLLDLVINSQVVVLKR